MFFPSVGFHKWKSSILLEDPVIKNKNRDYKVHIRKQSKFHQLNS